MRIAMIGPFGLHPKSTMRSRALGFARPFAARGHTVQLIMPPFHTPEEAGRTWEEDGVSLRYVLLDGGTVGTTRTMIRETLGWSPDVVHCFKPKAYSGLVAWWLWQFHRERLPLVMDTDDWEGWGGWNDHAPYSAVQKRVFAWQESYGLTHAHIVTAASRTLRDRTLALGLPIDKVRYLPNGPGVSTKPVSAEARAAVREQLELGERPTVLVYSRLFEFDTARLVTTLQAVRQEIPDLAVLFVGAGLYEDDASRFRAQLSGAGLDESVVDVGWTELAHLPATLAAGDVGLYPMDDTLLNWAKCPVKLADMLAVGVPVVGERIGQVGEYVLDGRTGLLVDSGDSAGMAAGLVALLRDDPRRAAYGTAAREDMALRFNWDTLSTELEQVYEDLQRMTAARR